MKVTKMTGGIFQQFALAAVLAAIIPSLAVAQGMPDTAGRVEAVRGSAALKRNATQVRTLRKNDSLAVGDEIVTGQDSRVTIRRADGSKVQVFSDSRIVFRNPSNGFVEFLHLFIGSVKVRIEHLSGRPNDHQMATPTAVIAVRGTTFSVLVDSAENTLVAVDDGLVSVVNNAFPGTEVLLRRRERSWVRRGQPPEAPQPFRGNSEREGLMNGQGPGANRGPAPIAPPMGAGGGFGTLRGSGGGRGRGRP